MKFEEALDWIIKYDMENSKSCLEAGKIKNWKKEFDLVELF
jgi:hypothetical protein